MTRLLLLDDEPELREEVAEFLRDRHFSVTEVGSIAEFNAQFREDAFDIAIIDRMLPDGDGLSLVHALRQAQTRVGLIMLTARDSSPDRIAGYAQGADHYLGKPIRLDELVAILDALQRRLQPARHWRLDVPAGALTTPEGQEIKLTALECFFLASIANQAGATVSRRALIEALGKDYASYDPRSLDALVLRLRRKVADQTEQPFPVRTVHGAGYALAGSVDVHT